MEYLNTPSPLKMNDFYYSSTLDDESDSFAKKCENKICAVVVDNPNKGFYAKFTSSFSYFAQTFFTCKPSDSSLFTFHFSLAKPLFSSWSQFSLPLVPCYA